MRLNSNACIINNNLLKHLPNQPRPRLYNQIWWYKEEQFLVIYQLFHLLTLFTYQSTLTTFCLSAYLGFFQWFRETVPELRGPNSVVHTPAGSETLQRSGKPWITLCCHCSLLPITMSYIRSSYTPENSKKLDYNECEDSLRS